MTLSEVKEYLRVDNNADDNLITTLMRAADSYMRTAIENYDSKLASADTDSDWVFKVNTAKMLLINDWYENRLSTARPVAASVSLLITQLQYDTIEGDTDEA